MQTEAMPIDKAETIRGKLESMFSNAPEAIGAVDTAILEKDD